MAGPLRATAALLRRYRNLNRGLARKGPSLHPKHGPKSFYKGYGATSMGRHTRRGGYVIDWSNRVPEFVVPDLVGCELQPYVSYRTPKVTVPPPPNVMPKRFAIPPPRNK